MKDFSPGSWQCWNGGVDSRARRERLTQQLGSNGYSRRWYFRCRLRSPSVQNFSQKKRLGVFTRGRPSSDPSFRDRPEDGAILGE